MSNPFDYLNAILQNKKNLIDNKDELKSFNNGSGNLGY